MPPRPFPFPISIGTDICHIARIRKLITSHKGSGAQRFSRRILAKQELTRHSLIIETLMEGWKSLKAHQKDELKANLRDRSEGLDMGRNTRLTDDQILETPLTDGGTRISRTNVVGNTWSAAQFLAGRFAAKEAIIKAHHSRRLTYHDIDIIKQTPPSGKHTASMPPVAHIRGESGDWDAEDGQLLPISISHDGEYATATCIAYEPNLGGAVVESPTKTHKDRAAD